MFGLIQNKVLLSNVNPRVELHGDEHVMAADLKLVLTGSNDVLSEFHPTLKAALYDAPEVQDLVGDPGHRPVLRFDAMGPVRWSWDGVGYSMTIHAGLDSRSDIALDLVDIDNFQFECQEGGSVKTTFRAKCHPSQEVIGKLCAMIQQDISVSLMPPSAE